MLPQEKFHLVRVFSGDKVFGFQFFDSNLQLKFEIGHCQNASVTEVVLHEKEQIIGFTAKPWEKWGNIYSDLQFMICKLN